MGSDTLPGFGSPDIRQGNNFSISIAAESREEADRICNGLSAGGTIIMPLADTFWGAYFGMWMDKFGIQWMINYDYPRE
jgi:PhnB protein